MTGAQDDATRSTRADAATVRSYLRALNRSGDANKDPALASRANCEQALKRVQERIDAADRTTVVFVRLVRRRRILEAALDGFGDGNLESAAAEAIARLSANEGFIYADWREAGVPPHVLKLAGVRP